MYNKLTLNGFSTNNDQDFYIFYDLKKNLILINDKLTKEEDEEFLIFSITYILKMKNYHLLHKDAFFEMYNEPNFNPQILNLALQSHILLEMKDLNLLNDFQRNHHILSKLVSISDSNLNIGIDIFETIDILSKLSNDEFENLINNA